jgi:CSLREA domain-containing protein
MLCWYGPAGVSRETAGRTATIVPDYCYSLVNADYLLPQVAMNRYMVAFLAVCSLLMCGPVWAAATWVVTKTADTNDGKCDGDCSLREAIAAAGSGDTINFSGLTLPATITLTLGDLVIGNFMTITINGPGADQLAIDGNQASRVFWVYDVGSLTLSDLTIQHGQNDDGGGILNYGTVTLTNCTLSDNGAYYGGYILNYGTVTFTNCTLRGNVAVEGGGIHNGGTATLTNCTLSGNAAYGLAGGIYNRGTATLTDCILSGNSAGRPDYGGGAIVNEGTATLTNCTLSGNVADFGGAIANPRWGNTATTRLIGCTLTGNSAHTGGALYLDATTTVTASRLSGNAADGDGGAIYNTNQYTNQGTMALAACTLSGNTAGGDGGGLANLGGTAAIANSTFSGNSAGAGGGIANLGDTIAITNSTFSDNSSTGSGGAIYNTATCDTGDAPCAATLTNTIVANSTQADNCAGTITDDGHNLDDGTSCGFSTANRSLSNTDPQLDPAGLKDNGGPTQTVALCTAVGTPAGCTAASPAIDAGDDSICAEVPVNNRDQRGFLRPGISNRHCSIGAYEADATEVCTGDCGGTLTVGINDLVTLVNIALGHAEPSACPQGVPSGRAVDITLIIQAVNNTLGQCPGLPGPTFTITPPGVDPILRQISGSDRLMPCGSECMCW